MRTLPRVPSYSVWDRIRGYIELPHPWAVLIVMLATTAFAVLATDGQPDPGRLALLLATMLGGQLAIGAVNEYRDRELDALSKPERPIPSGRVHPRGALAMAGGGLALMLVAGVALGLVPLAVVALGTGCGLVYDLWLKGTHWSWLPYLVALPLLPTWVWLTMDQFELSLLLLYPLGAPMVLAVHLAQSLTDAESDRAAGVRSLVARLGQRQSLLVLVGAALIAALEIALFAARFSDRPAPALLASALVVAVVVGSLLLRRFNQMAVDRHLFKALTAVTVVLGIGWVLAVGV